MVFLVNKTNFAAENSSIYSIMEYKKHFSGEELNSLIAWFEAHKDRFPASLQVDKATFIPDLPHTVRLYYDIVNEHKDNPTYAAQIFLLFKIQKILQEQWNSD